MALITVSLLLKIIYLSKLLICIRNERLFICYKGFGDIFYNLINNPLGTYFERQTIAKSICFASPTPLSKINISDPLVDFGCCLLYGGVVVTLTHSPFPFKINLFEKMGLQCSEKLPHP